MGWDGMGELMDEWMKGKRRKQGEMGKSRGRGGKKRELGSWVTVV